MKVTVLGCGASSGVPLIGCKCAVCTSTNPKNKRTRVSILVETDGQSILVDTPPDMRMQFLREGYSKVDALIYTHDHADHLHGLDDTRCFNHTLGAPLNIYSDVKTLDSIQHKFKYAFQVPKPPTTKGEWGWYRPCLVPNVIKPNEPFALGKTKILAFEQKHGTGVTLGLRFGNFAYSTDANGLSEEAFKALEGVDTWIVDCLRHEPAPTHSHLDLTLEWTRRVKPRRTYLTHMNHNFDYDKLAAELPEGVFPAYDGLKLDIA